MSHLRFDDETDRIAKYRLKATRGYLQTYNAQYRYPIDYENERNSRTERSEPKREEVAIQPLKRSYPKNYQQYRLLRSRLPREPRERSVARSQGRESRGLAGRELASSSSSKDSKLLNNNQRPDDKASMNGEAKESTKEPTKESSLGRPTRMGGERILSSILSSKIVSLKDNEQITASKHTTGQRINFRSELLPNLVYNNLIRRAGAVDQMRKQELKSEPKPEPKSERKSVAASNGDGGETVSSSEQAGNERSINQMYIQRYSNQTVKNGNSTNLKRHLNDAVLLTNVSLNRDDSTESASNAGLSSDELPSILQNTLLSGDASSIQETLLPSINASTILNLIRSLNLTNGSSEVESSSSDLEILSNVERTSDSGLSDAPELTSSEPSPKLSSERSSELSLESSPESSPEQSRELSSNTSPELPSKSSSFPLPSEPSSYPNELSDLVRPPKFHSAHSTSKKAEPTDNQQSADHRANLVQPTRAFGSGQRIAKSASLYNPLELQLIKLAPTMISNRI